MSTCGKDKLQCKKYLLEFGFSYDTIYIVLLLKTWHDNYIILKP
jgi:hypothetical protein